MARGSDVDENGNPIDPEQDPRLPPPPPAMFDNTAPRPLGPTAGHTPLPVSSGQPPGTKLVGKSPTGADIYADEQGNQFVQGMGGWIPYKPDGSGAPAPTPPPKGGGPAPTGGMSPWDKTFTAPAPVDLGGTSGLPYIPNAPTFTGPAFPTIPKFTAPTADEALNDPGYQFVRDQGRDSLQNWAAARGTLNDSGTAKSLEDYGQNAATTQYANVWNRDYQGYQSDVNTQYIAPWTAAQSNWLNGTVNPGLSEWQTMASAGQHAEDMSQSNARQDYLNSWNIWQQKWQDAFNVAKA